MDSSIVITMAQCWCIGQYYSTIAGTMMYHDQYHGLLPVPREVPW